MPHIICNMAALDEDVILYTGECLVIVMCVLSSAKILFLSHERLDKHLFHSYRPCSNNARTSAPCSKSSDPHATSDTRLQDSIM